MGLTTRTAHPPVARASKLPRIKDAVLAYGFPTGGESLSITRGIVSRIEFVGYNLGVSGLRIQVDAPINPGNSGGPAIAAGKMIGLVFSHLVGSENIGYIIPNEEIELFLKDVAAGRPVVAVRAKADRELADPVREHIEGLNGKEVCDLLDITEGNQRILLHRGRSRLREELEAEFGKV